MDYLHDSGYLYYNFEPSEEEFKEKLDIFEIYETDEPKDLQEIPIKQSNDPIKVTFLQL